MKSNLEHLLSKHGVMTSFSIAKKLNDESIRQMTDKIKSVAKNKIDFNVKLKAEIENDTTNSILNGTIPGLIIDGIVKAHKTPVTDSNKKPQLIYDVDKAKLAQLFAIASFFSKEVLNNKLTKNDICFTIFTILNFLEIDDEDFKRFHDSLDKSKESDENDEDYE